MSRIYNVTGSVRDWLIENSENLYDDILQSAEEGALKRMNVVKICKIKSLTGITEYVINTPEGVVESLKKAEAYYVMREEYEKAARARDCGVLWEEKTMIYNQNISQI